MCSLCGVLGGQAHWTDAVGDASAFPGRQVPQTRFQERQHRVRLVNRILGHYGLSLSDSGGSAFLLSTHTGRTVIVDNLTQMWAAAEELLGRHCDPLDPELMSALEGEEHKR